MYDEDSFSKHIFWMKFRRVFLLIFFSIIGCAIGVLISSYLIELVFLPVQIRVPIVAGSTLALFFITLFSTSKINNDIQDGYWKIAVLRKLTLISKKLDNLDKLDNLEKLELLNNLDTNVNQTLSELQKQTNKKPQKFRKITKKEN